MQLYKRSFVESGQSVGRPGEAVPQNLVIGDVDHCVATLKSFVREYGITNIVSWAVPPGLRPAQFADSLGALFTKVVPRLKAELPEG